MLTRLPIRLDLAQISQSDADEDHVAVRDFAKLDGPLVFLK